MLLLLLAIGLAGLPGLASAHMEGGSASVMPDWTLTPWLLASLAICLLWYAAGWARQWRAARRPIGELLRRALGFGFGWLALVAALVSPVDAAGGVSFAAHMVQHELLMIVAAPLLITGRPATTWLWACPPMTRRVLGRISASAVGAGWRWLLKPLPAWLLHFLALWCWHVPALFQAALRHEAVHVAQHASFFLSALVFWWSVMQGRRRPQSDGGAVFSLFSTMMHTGALGVLLTLSNTLWYPDYGWRAAVFGLSPLEDQQLGGLIMWIPGGLVYVIVALVLCAQCLLQQDHARADEGEQHA